MSRHVPQRITQGLGEEQIVRRALTYGQLQANLVKIADRLVRRIQFDKVSTLNSTAETPVLVVQGDGLSTSPTASSLRSTWHATLTML